MEISLKLIYQYMAIFFNFPPTSSHLHPLQVENCDSNSRLVVDEDDNGKSKLKRVKAELRSYANAVTMIGRCSRRWPIIKTVFVYYFMLLHKPQAEVSMCQTLACSKRRQRY